MDVYQLIPFYTDKNNGNTSSRGGLVVEPSLHKRHDSATVNPIPLGTMCLYGTFGTCYRGTAKRSAHNKSKDKELKQ